MSQVETEDQIGYLDFVVEEEKPKEQIHHWADPINKNLSWCGKLQASPPPYAGTRTRKASEINCVGCLQLGVTFGFRWWWRTHNTFYRSSCSSEAHNCNQ